MSFKRQYHCGKLSLFSGATAVQSRPNSYKFTINFAVSAPQPRWRQKPWKGLLSTELRYVFQEIQVFFAQYVALIVHDIVLVPYIIIVQW